MKKYYSASKNGFYSTDINGDDLPTDAYEISDEDYNDLFYGQSNGGIISADTDGKPSLIQPEPETTQQFNANQRLLRAAAFSAEHDPIAMQYLRGEDEITKSDLITLAADIRARFPYQV